MRRLACFLIVFAAAATASGDGGRLRLRQDCGPFSISIFTSPEPLTAGPAQVSVLVQDRASGEVVLDAAVRISVRRPDGGVLPGIQPDRAPNRFLQSATVPLDLPGRWELTVAVSRGAVTETVTGVLPVAPATSRLAAVWPFLALPPLAVALFAARGALRPRRRRPVM